MIQPATGGFAIFVPVIMSAGLLVSILTILRDALHWSRRRRRCADNARRAATSADFVRSGAASDDLRTGVLRARWFYSATAITAGAAAAYIGVGATANYLREDGYVSNIAWLWAVAMLTSVLLACVGVLTLLVAVRWPNVPGLARPLVVHGVLAQHPDAADRPPMALVAAMWVSIASFVILTLQVVVSPHLLEGIDGRLGDTLRDAAWARSLEVLDPLGQTGLAVLLAVAIGLTTLRCPVFAMTYLGMVGVGLVTTNAVRVVVGRARPDGPLGRLDDSFPSGQVVQATLLVGLVAGAILVWTRRRDLALALAVVTGVVVVLSGLGRVATGHHWPSDVAGGVLLGSSLVLVGMWVLEHRRWHLRCRGCPWQATAAAPANDRAVIAVDPRVARRVGLLARVWAVAAVAGFAVLALVVGLPRNPEGDSLGAQIEVPLQQGLLVIVIVGALLSLRWAAAGATVMAIGGLALGMVAAIAYPPLVAVLVIAVFLAPAVGVWFAWQHDRSLRAIAALALVAAGLVTVGWAGADATHGRFFGPAHPTSPLRSEEVDDVEWIWSGAVTDHTAVVTARLDDAAAGAGAALLRVTAAGTVEAVVVVVRATPDEQRIVRWELDGLAPGTEYDYRVEVGGEPDETRGDGTFRTFESGPQSFTVAVASCARTGSSGAVYDTIRQSDPDLYIAAGDIHYGNLAENDVGLFLRYYDHVLTAASQAALYSEVPVAYVWDDHDYGPNDADASSPSRQAARTAYSEAVPHYPRPAGADGAIYQAFTIGRVRFILTDTRSDRTEASMLGSTQLDWLDRELREAGPSHALVVWVNPDPWIAPDDPGRDDWGGYAHERRRIADIIADVGTENFVMLSGDAHMVALDDGTNSDYSTLGDGAGFPVLHAAALDRPGNVKGGPYSDGAYPGAGQFGTLTVLDDGGDQLTVHLAGHTWDGELLTELTETVQVPPAAR